MDITETLPSERSHYMPANGLLTLWVIYDHPLDFPDGFVLRAQWAMRSGAIQVDRVAWYAKTADELRSIVPPDLFCISRQPDDPKVILETWL